MATLELDPVFVKALKLLHSKSKDSTEQLKQLLDDAIAQRNAAKGETQAEKTPAKPSAQGSDEHVKKREGDMKSLEKLKQDLTGLSHEVKKPRLDPPRPSKEEKLQREREKERSRKEKEQKEKEEREKKAAAERERLREAEESSSTEDDADDDDSSDVAADDFAMGLGISCVVCRQFDVSSGNQLVECQECHNLYHQECHRPPVTERDVNDPRFVWYCTRCMKSIKKMQVSKPQKAKAVSTPTISKDPTNVQKQIKSEPGSLFSFRRVEPKSSSSKDPVSSQTTKPLSGLASLAANLYGKSAHEPSKAAKLEQSKSRSVSVSKPFQSDKTPSSNIPERRSSLTPERGAKQAVQDKLAAAALLMNKSGLTGNKAGGTVTGSKSGQTGMISASKGASPAPTSGNKGGGAAPPLVPTTGKSGEPKAIAADKRLQMMKKKAAVKLQEKRTSLK